MQNLLDGSGPIRLKKCRRGYMLYSTNDTTIGQLLDRFGEFSEGEAQLLENLIEPGDLVIEVGANIGSLTVPLAQAVGPQGRVIAFEPQHLLFQNLCANIALNGFANVTTLNVAAGATSGSVRLPRIDYATPGMFGAHSISAASEGDTVPLVTLDSFLQIDRCKLMKIDVEGMEHAVISGAVNLIRKFQPVLYVENDRKEKSPQLIEALSDLGYTMYWHLPPVRRDDNFFGNTDGYASNLISINMLCAPPQLTVAGMDDMRINAPHEWWED